MVLPNVHYLGINEDNHERVEVVCINLENPLLFPTPIRSLKTWKEERRNIHFVEIRIIL